MTAPYVEDQWAIGLNRGNACISIHNGQLDCDNLMGARGVPQLHLDSSGSVPISFYDTQFGNPYAVMAFGGDINGYNFINCWINGGVHPVTHRYQAYFRNFLSCGLALPPSYYDQTPGQFEVFNVVPRNVITNSGVAGFINKDAAKCSRAFPQPAYFRSDAPHSRPPTRPKRQHFSLL